MTIGKMNKMLLYCLLILGIFTQTLWLYENNCFAAPKKPTAIVVDDATGEPIEGAVAIAIWRKLSTEKAVWFEGGIDVVVRIEEVVSDKEGKIYIDGFFRWRPFSQDPHLTIYKPGYVCWDQEDIYISEKLPTIKRTDYDANHRIARLKKYPEGFSFAGHWSFMDSVTYGDTAEAPKKLFEKAFDYERSDRIQENTRRNKEKEEKVNKEKQ